MQFYFENISKGRFGMSSRDQDQNIGPRSGSMNPGQKPSDPKQQSQDQGHKPTQQGQRPKPGKQQDAGH